MKVLVIVSSSGSGSHEPINRVGCRRLWLLEVLNVAVENTTPTPPFPPPIVSLWWCAIARYQSAWQICVLTVYWARTERTRGFAH